MKQETEEREEYNIIINKETKIELKCFQISKTFA
jgi:hypothetical protein